MTETPLPAKELWNMFIRLFNKNIEEIKNKQRFPKTNSIMKIKPNAKTIFDPKLINFNNQNISNPKQIIKKARDIGGFITIRKKDEEQSAINLYKELKQIKDFKELFEEYELEPHHIYRFGKYLTKLKTQEEEKIENLQNENMKLAQQLENKNKEEDEQYEKMKQHYKDKYDYKLEKINKKHDEILKTINKKHEDELEAAKQDNASKEAIEELKRLHEQQINDLNIKTKQAQQDALTKYKHRIEERMRKQTDYDIDKFKKDFEDIYGFAPGTSSFIDQKIKDQAYSLDKEQLLNVINKAIENNQLPKDANPEKIARAIYVNGSKDVMKRINRISNLAILTGYNHDLYNKLPGDVAQKVQKYITDKINDDIRKKNIKYILPKDKPRWEYAMQNKKLNPMLGRSAWRVN